jgi:hypothetical protein
MLRHKFRDEIPISAPLKVSKTLLPPHNAYYRRNALATERSLVCEIPPYTFNNIEIPAGRRNARGNDMQIGLRNETILTYGE